RDDEAGRADAALQRRLLKKRLLQRVQPRRRGDALDRRDLGALRLGTEHAAGVDDAAVHDHAAGAAVAVIAALFGTRQPQLVAQYFEQALTGLAEEVDRFPVDR